MGSRCFCGEVWTNVHPEIMQAMMQANTEEVDGKVGHDGYSVRAVQRMQAEFNKPVSVMYAYNGTAANILGLKAMLRPWDTIIASECTHINTHECGATEYQLGNKILTVPGPDGKVTVAALEAGLAKYRDFDFEPRVLVLTQPTEYGVLYTNEEIRTLCDFAHGKNMKVFVDGARIGHALAALDTNLQAMIGDTGVDAFSYGGTKAGLMFGEMVVFLRDEYAEGMAYSQKQCLQHMDKSKFMGVQFDYLLGTGLWRRTAEHANAMAQKIGQALAARGLKAEFPVQTNMVFVRVTDEQMAAIRSEFDLGYWEEEAKLVRFAATHETTDAMIEKLAELL